LPWLDEGVGAAKLHPPQMKLFPASNTDCPVP
jgi:hypothetical protein